MKLPPPIRIVLASVVLFGVSSARAESEPPPNILFIMVDDLGKDWIGCYGADDIETPRIDALAEGGMKFHNAWSMPQCTPTRVTLLTGQYPWRTGWVNHWDVPRWGVGYFDWKKYTTFAEVMRSAGYATAIAGKWQINDFRLEPNALDEHGFDEWAMWTGGEGGNPKSNERYWDPYVHIGEESRIREGVFGPDLYCDFLVDFMKEHREEPMMLYFPMCLTHGPLVPTPHEREVEGRMDRHEAMVRYTDHLVGRLVDALDELELRERTIVIFTTDNGTAGGLLGSVNGREPSGGKASKFEGGVCVPFIVNGPGRAPAGVETDALTDFSDLFPTFAELGGAEIPEGRTLDGRSIAPLLLGEADDSPRDWILAMGHGPARLDEEGVRGVQDYASRVIRGDRYKIWVNTEKEITALYDLEEDPLEQDNLIDSSEAEHVAALERLRQVADATPDRDARPRYRERAANPWDLDPKAMREKREKRKQRKKKSGGN